MSHTNNVTLRPASDRPRADFLRAFNASFANYYAPVQLTEQSFELIIQREAVRMDSSVVAVQEDEVVGVGLLAVRGQRGWIGGMGVVPERRRQGIAQRMMDELIRQARLLGLAHLQLEVITLNEGAFVLYESLGFKTLRNLLVLACEPPIGDIPLPENASDIRVCFDPPEELVKLLPELTFTDFPWQRDPASLWGMLDRLDGVSARREADNAPLGVALWSGSAERAGVLAVNAALPQIGRALIAALRRELPEARLIYNNVPEDDPVLPALYETGFVEHLRQYEMHLPLAPEVQI